MSGDHPDWWLAGDPDPRLEGTHSMTELQQAYDRAMAHNAILREALKVTTATLDKRSEGYDADDVTLGEQALNATEADVTAWEKAYVAKLLQPTPGCVQAFSMAKTEYQQAYDRAMAHNALLREALSGAVCWCLPKRVWEHVAESATKICDRCKTLNATEADVTAWLQAHDDKQFDVYTKIAQAACLEVKGIKQQLATVTKERDALRDMVELLKKEVLTRNNSSF